MGVRRGDRVGIWTDRSPEHLVGQLGILQTGSAYVPLAVDEPVDRASLILRDADVRAVVVDRERAGRLDWLSLPLLVVAETAGIDGGGPLPVTSDATDGAYIIYTSGSTGRPKGAMIDHWAIVDRVRWAGAHSQFRAGDVAIHLSSLAFDVALIPSWATIGNGSAMVMPTSDELRIR